MYQVTIQRAAKEASAPTSHRLRKWATLALEKEVKAADITIRLVTVEEMTQLNTNYRKKPGPTNVLSFPFYSHTGVELDVPFLGDIVICAAIVNQEAQQLCIENKAHWAHIVIHGVLHLLGHDHVRDEEAVKMESLEISLLADLGFANPYEQGDDINHYE